MKRLASVAQQAGLLALVVAAFGCGGGNGLFSQPERDWDIRLGFISENPPGCGDDVTTTLRGDVFFEGSSVEIVVYFDDTDTCNSLKWRLSGSMQSDTHALFADQEEQRICQLAESLGVTEFRFENLRVDFTPEMESFSGMGNCWPEFGSDQCIGVIQLSGDLRGRGW